MATEKGHTPSAQGPELRFRWMALDDLEQVLDIERQSFLTPWTPDLFVNEFSNWRSYKGVVEQVDEARILGYVIWWQILDEAHLMNIAVDPAVYRRGVAKRMLDEMIRVCRDKGASRITLEVRQGNTPAIRLYLRYGFKAVGLRKNYYSDEGEDAVLMDLVLT